MFISGNLAVNRALGILVTAKMQRKSDRDIVSGFQQKEWNFGLGTSREAHVGSEGKGCAAEPVFQQPCPLSSRLLFFSWDGLKEVKEVPSEEAQGIQV